MAGLLNRAKETAQRGYDAGKEKVEELQAIRAGHELLRKLGTAYFAEQRRGGSHVAVTEALDAVERHIRGHGDAFLRSSSTSSAGGRTAA